MVERVLVLLIESGMAYTFIWTLYIASDTATLLDTAVSDTPKAYNQVTSVKSVADSAMVHITAIYRTMLIIFIALGKIQREQQFVDDAPMAQAPRVISHPVIVSIDMDIERSGGHGPEWHDFTSMPDDGDVLYAWSPKDE